MEGVVGDRDEIKRRSARLLKEAGREHLGPLGVSQNGRSSRLWTADRGWWLINVEFQPSVGRVGSYLNVGLQHLWSENDFRSFQFGYRQEVEGYGQFVDLDVDDESAMRATEALGRAAAKEVARWLEGLSDDRAHLAWLANYPKPSSLWDRLDAGFALAAIGQHARAQALFTTLSDPQRDPWPEDLAIPSWRRELAERCAGLATSLDSPSDFESSAQQAIDRTRMLLGLRRR